MIIASLNENTFDEGAQKDFIIGAKIAYENIITSFSSGNLKSVKELLDKKVYNQFDEAIKYFKLSTAETKYEDIAWSYYLKDDLKELSKEITGLTNKNKESRLISALATH